MQDIAEAWAWIGANSAAIQAVLLVFATIAAFVVIKHNAIVSRRETTIEMVHAQFGEEGQHYEGFKSFFLELEEANQQLTDFAAETADNKLGRNILLRQLNRYELISLAMAKGVFDERFYKRWFFSQFTRDYERLSPLINAMRKHFENDAYFCEFERAAFRWNRKRHPVKYPPKWKVIWWVLTDRRGKARSALRKD